MINKRKLNEAKTLVNTNVELSEMLTARERRVFVQKELIHGRPLSLISFTLNIPGPVKVLPLVPEAFFDGIEAIRSALKGAGCTVQKEKILLEKTGLEAFFAVRGKAEDIKNLMIPIEDGSGIGRLFDIDVIRPDGTKVSREDLTLPARTCLLCGNPAHDCSRNRTHSVEELSKKIASILTEQYGNSN